MENSSPVCALEAMFVSQLPMIKEAIRAVCRRHRICGDEATEFTASFFLKIVEDDYAVFRRFCSSTDPKSFLFAVAHHHMLDCRNQEWGKWRASARARQLGSAAVFLEKLIVRDRIEVQQALAVLAHHPRWHLSSHDARALHGELNCRVSRDRRPVDLAGVEATHAAAPERSALEVDELRDEAQRARRALSSAIRELPAEERRLLRMRFQEGRQMSEIAALLNLDAKPLYRRFGRILQRLRQDLERTNLTSTVVRRLVGRECVEFASGLPGESASASE